MHEGPTENRLGEFGSLYKYYYYYYYYYYYNCGVHQGSCTGPILFTVYVSRFFEHYSQDLPSVNGNADETDLPLLPTCL